MSFIAREIDRLSTKFSELGAEAPQAPEFRAAIQALSWALEPNGIKNPYAMLTGIPEVQEGYLAAPHPVQFSDKNSHSDLPQ